jgi:hypothetical protein
MHHARPLLLRHLAALSCGLLSLSALPANAVSYGIYDARGLAMGGTAVAAGTTSQAQFYNPALLSFHDKDEDDSRDGRVSFPNIVAQFSESVETALEAADDNLDEQLRSAVNNFNATPGSESAAQVASVSRDINDLLDDLGNQDLNLDAFVGFSVSEPSRREGGAFFFGVRALGAGASDISEADRALLNQYIEAMDVVAAGGSIGTINPALLDENGNLRDPVDELTSSGDVSALTIGEWGVSLAKEFEIDGDAISFGITPKLQRVDAYRDTLDVSSGITSSNDGARRFSDSQKTHITFNADLGIAAIIEDHYRISVAVKDVLAKEFSTQPQVDPDTGETLPAQIVQLKPRARLGFAYVNNNLTLGLDFDLRESTPLANEAPTKDLSLGIEYIAFDRLALRAGYREDQTNLRSSVASGGIGYQWGNAIFELSYAASSELEAGSLQFGWAF